MSDTDDAIFELLETEEAALRAFEASAESAEFRAAFVEFVMGWNRLEAALRTALSLLCGLTPQSEILTVELGTTGLANALRTVANDLIAEPIRGALLHALKCFEGLREFRNYYVHGLVALAQDADNMSLAVGIISMSSAKGRLTDHEEYVAIEQVRLLAGQIRDLHRFVGALLLHIHADKNPPPPGFPLPPLQERPPQPDRLRKHRRFRMSEPPPPQS